MLYSLLLFTGLMAPVVWFHSRGRKVERMQRSLRTYLGRTA